jgi:hypothetical protein
MRTRYVRDEKAIIHLQGIRWVTRTDHFYITNGKTIYELEVDYKPRSLVIKYDTAAERDGLFDKLCEALAPADMKTSTEGGEPT